MVSYFTVLFLYAVALASAKRELSQHISIQDQGHIAIGVASSEGRPIVIGNWKGEIPTPNDGGAVNYIKLLNAMAARYKANWSEGAGMDVVIATALPFLDIAAGKLDGFFQLAAQDWYGGSFKFPPTEALIRRFNRQLLARPKGPARNSETTIEQLNSIGVEAMTAERLGPLTDIAESAPWKIIGHTERRFYMKKPPQIPAMKVMNMLSRRNGGIAIFCVGNDLDDRQEASFNAVRAKAARVKDEARAQSMVVQESLRIKEEIETSEARGLPRDILDQIESLVEYVGPRAWHNRVVIAYDPVWATTIKTAASGAQIQNTCLQLRAWIGQRSRTVARTVRIVYGGSVNKDNAHQLLMDAPCLNGFLLGSASRKIDHFTAVVNTVSQVFKS
jgi:triosephosphate isomerase